MSNMVKILKLPSARIDLAGAVIVCASVACAGAEGMMTRLDPGEVKPRGWLRDWCETARDGYLLHLDEYDAEFRRAWSVDYTPTGARLSWQPVKNEKTGEMEPGFWSAEGGNYWFGGVVPMAAQLDDPKLLELARRRLGPLVAHMHENSLSFIWWLDRRKPEDLTSITEPKVGDRAWAFFASGIFGRTLCDYYRVTRDPKALEALEWGLNDPQCARWSATYVSAAVEALRLGAGKSIAAAVDFARKEVFDKKFYYARGPKERGAKVPHGVTKLWYWEPNGHGVLTHENLLAVLRMYEHTGERRYLDSVLEWMVFFDSFAWQPTGVPVCDEGFGLTGGNRGTETCDVFLSNYLRSELAAVTGDGKWCDDVERGFFNAAAACTSRDFKRHCYIQTPDMVTKDQPGDRLTFSSGEENVRCRMKPTHYPLCCTASLCRNLPGYISASWLRTPDDGLAAALWMPCDVKTQVRGKSVGISVKTDYPFGETVAMELKLDDGPQAFPLVLHIPGWCQEAKVSVNGECVKAEVCRGFVRLERPWTSGDRIDLVFPMVPRLETGVDRNGPTEKGWASVVCGPLLFSLGFPEKDEDTGADPAFAWDYWLDPATALVGAKVERKPMPAKWGWQLDAPVRVSVKAATGETLSLVPYGCTRLRKTMFSRGLPQETRGGQ